MSSFQHPEDHQDFSGMFSAFLLQYCKWSRSGEEPCDADLNLRHYLDLQEHRLKQQNLQMELTMEPMGSVCALHRFWAKNPLMKDTFLGRFTHTIYGQPVRRKLVFLRQDQVVFEEKSQKLFYESIISPNPDSEYIASTPYVCPSCGAVSPLSTLTENGCPYCKTHFIMSQLYPKVSNYFILDGTPFERENILKDLQKILRLDLILSGAFALLPDLFGIFSGNFSIFSLFTIPVSFLSLFIPIGIFLYVALSLRYLGKLLLMGIGSCRVILGSAGDKERITRKLQKWDPRFDYEYFEAKALSLARIILFHDNPADCAQYDGRDPGRKFTGILDAQYRGGLKLRSIEKRNHRIYITVDLYLTLTELYKGKVRIRKKKMTLQMYHNADTPVNPSFYIRKVQCPGCAGSFDAANHRFCPFCAQAYDAGVQDWAVSEIH